MWAITQINKILGNICLRGPMDHACKQTQGIEISSILSHNVIVSSLVLTCSFRMEGIPTLPVKVIGSSVSKGIARPKLILCIVKLIFEPLKTILLKK